METIGSFEAKTHWSSLLDKVGNGHEFIITKHGKPIARLIPESLIEDRRTLEAAEALKTMRKGIMLDGLDWKSLRDEGRVR